MPSLILLAYHFPPETAIGAARPYRFYKYLRRLGYTVHVITASPQPSDQAHPDQAPDVEYIPDPFFSGVHNLGWHMERAVRKFLLPGVLGLRWAHAAAAAARRFQTKHPGPASVLSTSPPFGTHYAAWHLSRSEKIPWTADFRDPFGGVSLAMGGLNPFQKRLFNWLEKKVIHSANLIIANTDSMAAKWQRQHPTRAANIHLLWNGFDPEAPIRAKELPTRSYKLLSHVGELYAGRTVTPILESIGRLLDAGILPRHSLQVNIIGPAKPSALPAPEFVERSRRQGWLHLFAQAIEQPAAREITQTSDFLLLLQPQSAVQVPGKLFEYLQIGRPILAFVMRNSPVERILSKSGVPYRCVYPDCSSAEFDRAITEFLTLPSIPILPSLWFQQNFAAGNQAKTLLSLLQSTENVV